MKKPYDREKDFSFTTPAVCRTSNVRVTKRNIELIQNFFTALMKKNSVHETMCFMRKVSSDGSVARECQRVSASTFELKEGVTFKYVHTLGISERIIVNETFDDARVERVYTISG